MKNLLAIFFLFSTALLAVPSFSVVEFSMTHGSMRVRVLPVGADGMSYLAVQYGETTTITNASSNHSENYQGSGNYHHIFESGLHPNTLYYARVRVIVGAFDVTTSCTSGQTGVGWTCDAASGMYKIQTSALPADHGSVTLPAPLDTSMPVFNGTNFPVDSTCSNLQAQIDACALAPKNLNHTISIPPSAVCTVGYNLPAKTGTGTDTGFCTIRPSSTDTQLPPEGTQASDAYVSTMATFRRPVYNRGWEFFSAYTTGGNGYRLMGLRFENEAPGTTYTKLAITNIVRNDAYSIDVTMNTTGHPWSQDGMISIAGATGFSARGVNGTWKVSTWLSANSVRAVTGVYEKTGTFGPGTYTGGGFAYMRVGTPILSVTNATPPVVTTSVDHGLSDDPAYTITAASGANLTIAAGHGLDQYTTPIRITGSSNSAYNGFWNRNGVSGNTLTLTGSTGALTSCSSSCGTVRVSRALAIQNAVGAPGINGSHVFTVIDATHFSVDSAVASGVGTAGGFVAMDPDIYQSDVSFSSDTSRNMIDRCIFKGAGTFPNRQNSTITLHDNYGAIVDSRLEATKQWNAVNPISNNYEEGAFGARESISVFITQGNYQKIHNNFIECQGICVFSEEGTTVKNNMIVTRNYFYQNPVDMAGGPLTNHLYYVRRQHFELKQGDAMLIDGNTFDGGWVDATPAGSPILFTPRAHFGPNAYISNITVSNNIIRSGCSGIQISGVDTFNQPTGFVTSRMNITNNLFYDLDCKKWLSNPSLTGGTAVQGYALVIFGPTQDISFTHNTVLDGRGGQPAAIQYLYGKHEGMRIQDNLLIHHDSNGAGMLASPGQFGSFPTVQGTTKERFDLSTYASFFDHNLIIPGVHYTALESNYTSTDSANTVTQAQCASYFAGFSNITCLGNPAGGDTAYQRMLLPGFRSVANYDLELLPSSAYLTGSTTNNAYGVDYERLRGAAAALLLNPRVHHVQSTQAIIGYNSTDACTVEYSTTPTQRTGTTVNIAANIAPGKDTTVTGLTSATVYHYWINCSAALKSGKFKTL